MSIFRRRNICMTPGELNRHRFMAFGIQVDGDEGFGITPSSEGYVGYYSFV